MSDFNPSLGDLEDVRELHARYVAGEFQTDNDHPAVIELSGLTLLPNGIPDPTTVTENLVQEARAFKKLSQAREVSVEVLGDLQKEYFEVIKLFAGPAIALATQSGKTGADIAAFLASKEEYAREIAQDAVELDDSLTRFWQDNLHLIQGALAKQMKNALIYTGSFIPDSQNSGLLRPALLSDLVIVPDPFIASLRMGTRMPEEWTARNSMRLAIDILEYEQTCLPAESDAISIVLPAAIDIGIGITDSQLQLAHEDVAVFCEQCFATRFSGSDEAREFLAGLKTSKDVEQAVRLSHMLRFAHPDKNTISERLDVYMQNEAVAETVKATSVLRDGTMYSIRSAGDHLFHHLLSRFLQSYGALNTASLYGGAPFMDAEISWHYHKWHLESRNAPIGQRELQAGRVAKALLESEFPELPVLNTTDPVQIMTLRAEPSFRQLRNIVPRFVSGSTPCASDIETHVDELCANAKELGLNISNKKDQLKSQYGRLLTFSAMSIAAVATDTPALAIVPGIIGHSTFKSLVESHKEHRELKKQLRANPVSAYLPTE